MRKLPVTLTVQKYFILRYKGREVILFKGDKLTVRERDADSYWINSVQTSTGEQSFRSMYRTKRYINAYANE